MEASFEGVGVSARILRFPSASGAVDRVVVHDRDGDPVDAAEITGLSVRLADLMHDEMVVRARVGLGPKAPTQLAAAHERRRRTTAVAVDRRLPILQD